MAAEIAVTMALVARKGGTVDGIDLGRFSVTMNGTRVIHNRQTVGTSEEQALVGDSGALGGWVLMVNRSATNFVSVRPSTGATNLIKMLPGEGCLFRHSGVTAPFLIADTAACEVEYLYVEA